MTINTLTASQSLKPGILFSLAMIMILVACPSIVQARADVCAQVKIEIHQEVSLERQAFDAVMKINNGLDTLSLDNIDIQVNFMDEHDSPVIASSDPNSTDAQFFIKIDRMQGITNVQGSGKVLPGTTAEIHWLIIPAPGAGANIPSGKLYQVGAKLSYNLGGEVEQVNVIPDIIYVKPLPKISLDYFLTKDVYADDPFTSEVEASEPFTLGVRIRNNGEASARNFKIDSAQPEIIENEQGLLIDFALVASTVDNKQVAPDLLLEFGDIAGNSSRVGRWWMITTLAGQFVDFTASWSHADELGGQLTSILQSVNTHLLIHDVRIDLTGRDEVDDFLALDGEQLRVYESDSIDSLVIDHSSSATLNFDSNSQGVSYYQLTIPQSGSFVFAKTADPFYGSKAILKVIRSDNKIMPLENAWLSREGNGSDGWQYFINLFDVNSPGSYTFLFGEKITSNQAPVIDFIPLQSGITGKRLTLEISATDPDQTIPVLSASALPIGASFTDQGDGTGLLVWIPSINQSGKHKITYRASDGDKTSERSATIDIQLIIMTDSDGDGMDDVWELTHFGTLLRDGLGDFDNDGIIDREEYQNDTDPADLSTTGLPQIHYPVVGSSISQQTTRLSIINAAHQPKTDIHYQFQLFADEALTQLVEQSELLIESSISTTDWTPALTLTDNHWYTWRVRAFNGSNYSQWVTGYFLVNRFNDAPTIPQILTPPDGAQVSSTTPLLEVIAATDKDADQLTYHFILYSDSSKTTIVDHLNNFSPADSDPVNWTVSTPLVDNTQYYWQVLVNDGKGGSTQSELASFTVNTSNQSPDAPLLLSPAQRSTIRSQSVELIINNSHDPENAPLQYIFEIDSQANFNSNARQTATIASGTEQTKWSLADLDDNTRYYWRVRAYDGSSYSQWSTAEFHINQQNDAPNVPVIVNPGNQSWVTTLEPILQIQQATDIDGDPVTYQYQLSISSAFSVNIIDSNSAQLNLPVETALLDNTWYYWRAKAIDSHKLGSEWTPINAFFVNSNSINDAPVITLLEPSRTTQINNSLMIRWTDQDPDSNASISLYYNTRPEIHNATLIVAGLEENAPASQDSYRWNTRTLAAGEYYIIARISDENNEMVSIAEGQVIKRGVRPKVHLSRDGTGIINEGEQIVLTTNISNSTAVFDYRYLQRRPGNTNWQLLQDWSNNHSYQWDSSGHSGATQIQVQVRFHNDSNSATISSNISLVVNKAISCDDLTAIELDSTNFQLSIHYIRHNNIWYHTQFSYQGEQADRQSWKLRHITEEAIDLPTSCTTDALLNGSELVLSDIHLSGTNIHYQATMAMRTNKNGLFLYLQSYGLKTQLNSSHSDTVTQGESVEFSTTVANPGNRYEYQYRLKADNETHYRIIQPWSLSNRYTLDTISLQAKVQIQVQARIADSSTIVGTDQQTLTINNLWSAAKCQAQTVSILNLDNNHLTIPYALYNDQYYHTEFNYLGQIDGILNWQLSSAVIEPQPLPSGCTAKFLLEGSSVTLSDFKIKDSALHYRASLILETRNDGIFLKLIDYSEL